MGTLRSLYFLTYSRDRASADTKVCSLIQIFRDLRWQDQSLQGILTRSMLRFWQSSNFIVQKNTFYVHEAHTVR
jgi:hypothetical protein